MERSLAVPVLRRDVRVPQSRDRVLERSEIEIRHRRPGRWRDKRNPGIRREIKRPIGDGPVAIFCIRPHLVRHFDQFVHVSGHRADKTVEVNGQSLSVGEAHRHPAAQL
jgi:hypothetical protein